MEYGSVTVEQIADAPVVWTNWLDTVRSQDIEQAYHAVMDVVNRSNERVYVVVDLSHEPRIPMRDLLNGALAGPYTDPKVAKWLVIGQDDRSRSMANTLFFVTGQHKVQWFENESAAFDYLQQSGWSLKH